MLKPKLIIFSIICGLFWPLTIHAANDQAPSYAINPQFTATQVSGQTGYFDIKVVPGKPQTISTIISNSGNRPIYVRHKFNSAYTTDSGLGYVPTNKPIKPDPSMRYPLTKVATVDGDDVVFIPAHQSKTVTAQIDAAKIAKDFHGIILGGWYFENIDKKPNTAANSNKDNSVGVNFTYSYLTGVVLEVGEPVKPKLALDELIYHGKAKQPALSVKLINSEAAILRHAKVTVSVTKKQQLVTKHTYTDITLAPNSNVEYPLNELKTLTPGKYIFTIVGENGHQKVTSHQMVTLTQQAESKPLHATIKPLTETKPNYLEWGIAIGILLGTIGIGSYIFWYRKK